MAGLDPAIHANAAAGRQMGTELSKFGSPVLAWMPALEAGMTVEWFRTAGIAGMPSAALPALAPRAMSRNA